MQQKIEKQRNKVMKLKQKEVQEAEKLEKLQNELAEEEETLQIMELNDIKSMMDLYNLCYEDVVQLLKRMNGSLEEAEEEIINVQSFEDLM